VIGPPFAFGNLSPPATSDHVIDHHQLRLKDAARLCPRRLRRSAPFRVGALEESLFASMFIEAPRDRGVRHPLFFHPPHGLGEVPLAIMNSASSLCRCRLVTTANFTAGQWVLLRQSTSRAFPLLPGRLRLRGMLSSGGPFNWMSCARLRGRFDNRPGSDILSPHAAKDAS